MTDLAKGLPEGTPVEIWFQDEARVGQKNGLVYQWARRGTRPRQPKDQRTAWAYIFGAVCVYGGDKLGHVAAVIGAAAPE
ncbi:hypothetical protein [Defluviicoccus vanus]|uniref:Uncharacterized protein n=1 Tax=Defluviicoccus vanus TaxID=111831 RepID=A0A7H1N1E7_9PROT|nr:hypothetical protein [Defluviicoccus vanus]QNT69533.1 hypothetical protein HQ394_09550 [Defluviicoccus vanus]